MLLFGKDGLFFVVVYHCCCSLIITNWHRNSTVLQKDGAKDGDEKKGWEELRRKRWKVMFAFMLTD